MKWKIIYKTTSWADKVKNNWNKKALDDDNKFLAEQDKIEPSESTETQANQ